jgi:hypothetical protein
MFFVRIDEWGSDAEMPMMATRIMACGRQKLPLAAWLSHSANWQACRDFEQQ